MTVTDGKSTIKVLPVTGLTGAEIEGVDLAGDLDAGTVSQIKAALLEWKVLAFRGQSLGHAEQIAFTRKLGRVTPARPGGEEQTDAEFPEILPSDSRGRLIRYGKPVTTDDEGNLWHMDETSVVNPPNATVLRAGSVPPYGGDTTWTNLVAAYEGLPQPLRDLAGTLRVRHSSGPKAAQLNAKEGTTLHRVGQHVLAHPRSSIHPLVRVIPENGERALFVSPVFMISANEIIGFSARHSRAILEFFYDEIARPQYTVRFRWDPGTVVLADNRSTAHLAGSDYGHLDFDRVLYRTLVEGDIPVGPDGTPSEALAGDPFLAVAR